MEPNVRADLVGNAAVTHAFRVGETNGWQRQSLGRAVRAYCAPGEAPWQSRRLLLAPLRGSRQFACMDEGLAAFVRRHDPDRFLTALFAPPARRDALLALYAFNHELARAREVVSEPPLALIRLQWWREVVEGAARRHEVATPLAAAIANGLLLPNDLLAMITAREIEAEPSIATLAEWRDYVRGVAGGVAVAAGRALGAVEPELLRPFGAAYGVAGLVRATPLLAARGRCLLPEDLLREHGLSVEAAAAAPASPSVRRVLSVLVEEGHALLARAAAVRLPRSALAAALPAVLARRDLACWSMPPAPRRLGDRLAVVLAAVRVRPVPRRPS
jgi:15-cis-phytoene synthase